MLSFAYKIPQWIDATEKHSLSLVGHVTQRRSHAHTFLVDKDKRIVNILPMLHNVKQGTRKSQTLIELTKKKNHLQPHQKMRWKETSSKNYR